MSVDIFGSISLGLFATLIDCVDIRIERLIKERMIKRALNLLNYPFNVSVFLIVMSTLWVKHYVEEGLTLARQAMLRRGEARRGEAVRRTQVFSTLSAGLFYGLACCKVGRQF